jgi:uncharacterized protein YeaO (DUF488 family)
MAVSIVRLGSRRARGEGIRIGTVRRPPRGVPRSQYARGNWYDVWLPTLAPSAALMRETRILENPSAWNVFARRFLAELKRPDAAHLLDTLAALSHDANFSVGCYCADDRRCHRSILRRVLQDRGALVR